jgi:hypothetical protein
MEIEFRVNNIASPEALEAIRFLQGSYFVTVKRIAPNLWLIRGER